jgi:hypothetical protein
MPEPEPGFIDAYLGRVGANKFQRSPERFALPTVTSLYLGVWLFAVLSTMTYGYVVAISHTSFCLYH